MQISFSATDIHELFEEWQDSKDDSCASGISKQIIQFPEKICDGWMQRLQIRPGMDMVMQNIQCQDALSLELEEEGNTDLLRLAFCLTGRTKGVVARNNHEMQFLSGHFGIGFAEDANSGTIEYTQGQTTILSAYIDRNVLNTLIGDQLDCLPKTVQKILEGQFVPFYFQSGRMTPTMNLAAKQVVLCPYQGLTKRLYLESKLLELLALLLHETTGDRCDSHHNGVLKSDDVERIYHARDILLSDLEHPPSLLQLSRFVGLNDYKLKIGFREVFGTTVFGYLFHRRMERAQELLMSEELNITAISELVGYTNLSAFSTAFKRKFGVTPTAYKLGKREC